MLIIEGSDLVGKTTLIKEICEQASERGFPMIPQHFGLLPDNWDFEKDYHDYVSKRTVMDRFVLSEVVYGETLRYGSRITPRMWQRLHSYNVCGPGPGYDLESSMTVIIAAESVFFKQHVHKQMQERVEVFKEEQICEVNDAFLDIIARHHFGKFDIYYDIAHIVTGNRDFPSSDPAFVSEIVETYLKLQGV